MRPPAHCSAVATWVYVDELLQRLHAVLAQDLPSFRSPITPIRMPSHGYVWL